MDAGEELDGLKELLQVMTGRSAEEYEAMDLDNLDLKMGTGDDDDEFEIPDIRNAARKAREAEATPAADTRKPDWKYAFAYATDILLDGAHESAATENLQPFVEAEKKKKTCVACKGTGMVQCEFCQGRGVVKLSKSEIRKVTFRKSVAVAPKKAKGGEDLYYCPFCGGLRYERCVECLGTGFVETEEERHKEDKSFGFIDDVDRGTFETDDEFGIRIWRRHKRPGRPPRKKAEAEVEENVEAAPASETKRRRGRPKGKANEEELTLPNLEDLKKKRPTGSTDFQNKTAFRVQEELGTQPKLWDTDPGSSPDGAEPPG